jgi:hypothetical protein
LTLARSLIISTTTSIPLVKQIGTITGGTASGFQGIGLFGHFQGLVGLQYMCELSDWTLMALRNNSKQEDLTKLWMPKMVFLGIPPSVWTEASEPRRAKHTALAWKKTGTVRSNKSRHRIDCHCVGFGRKGEIKFETGSIDVDIQTISGVTLGKILGRVGSISK